MNITFLIGNGFDLTCGLKTKYTDVYEKYCVTESPNENIEEFKKNILKDGYKNWTDFEMALPRFGKELNDFEKFSECIRDFAQFLEEYLEEEEKKIDIESNKHNLADKMQRYIYHFYNFCLRKSQIVLKTLIQEKNQNVICNFITFNYTDTLKRCLSTMSDNIRKGNTSVYTYTSPNHIHGTLYNGIILGLDNEELYKDIPCSDMRKLKNLIDKVYINSRYSNITDDLVATLEQSRIIVIFGWSMGESDSFWVETVKRIFSADKNVHLVYVPYYSEATNKRFRNQSLDREDEQKDFITTKFEIPEEHRDRVHIVTDTEYMKLNFLTNGSKEKELVTV